MSILVFEHEQACGPGRLGDVLLRYGHRLNVRRLWTGDAPPSDLDDVDAIVLLGSFASTASLLGATWSKGQATLVREAHGRQMPVIGIGTGSLLVALALGGAVGPLADGAVEMGWRESKLAFAGTVDTILTGQPWRSMQFVWLSEQVTKLPPDSAALAGTKKCRTLAWRAGVRTYGLGQLVEADAQAIARWSNLRGRERQAAGLGHEPLLAETARLMPEFGRLSDRLCRSIADYLLVSPMRQYA